MGLVRGKTWADTLALIANVTWHRTKRLICPSSALTPWWKSPFSLEGRLFWWPYLRAWADYAARTWANSPEPPFDFAGAIQKDSIGLDIGAHRGYWSLAYTQHIKPPGRVFLLEPHPENYAILVQNLHQNRLYAHIPLRMAAWHKPTWVELSEEGSDPSGFTYGVSREGGSIPATSIDWLASSFGLSRLDWMKVDVEGAEVEVLKGASHTLDTFRPVVWVEVRDATRDALRAFLAVKEYEIWAEYRFSEAMSYWWCVPRQS